MLAAIIDLRQSAIQKKPVREVRDPAFAGCPVCSPRFHKFSTLFSTRFMYILVLKLKSVGVWLSEPFDFHFPPGQRHLLSSPLVRRLLNDMRTGWKIPVIDVNISIIISSLQEQSSIWALFVFHFFLYFCGSGVEEWSSTVLLISSTSGIILIVIYAVINTIICTSIRFSRFQPGI